MGMTLAQALRLLPERFVADKAKSERDDNRQRAFSAAFVGAGGKTTAIFQLARQMAAPVIVTATTHMGAWQIPLADQHIIAHSPTDLAALEPRGVTLVTGPLGEDDRTQAVSEEVLLWLRDMSVARHIPLLIEADGARQKPLKAPAPHEPAIPAFVDLVVAVAGLSALGKPLEEDVVQRAEVFAGISGLSSGERIGAEALTRLLISSRGGCKNIPENARGVVLLNQADTPDLQAQARGMAPGLLAGFDSVLIASLSNGEVHACHERVAGIVLAAGEAKR
ncbi:MAG: selenium cofactor biosynthesis protein YqeC, partial [Ktedonobacterales bacterium]